MYAPSTTPYPQPCAWPSLTTVCCDSGVPQARANGYARAEAIGVVLLRSDSSTPLDSPLIDNVVVRHDGRSASLTAPNGSAQRMMLRAAWAGMDLPTICMEAHGTGTSLGDPTEIGALVSASASLQGGGLPISSHKANTGHAEAPSGVMGLLAALVREQRVALGNAQLRR